VSVLKIIHISQASGGVKTYIENIMYTLDREMYESILVSPDETFLEEATIKGIKSKYIAMKRSPNFKDIGVIWQLYRIIKKEKVDIIHCHSAKGGAIGRIVGFLTGTRVIFTPNAFSYLSFTGWKRKVYVSIEKGLKRFTDLFLGVSYSEKIRAIEEIGYNPARVNCVQNAIYPRTDKKTDYALLGRIGMIGRITHQKRPQDFIQLAAAIIEKGYKLKFELLGVGFHDHLLKEIKELIDQLGLQDHIELSPWGKYENVLDFFKTLDIYVMTSAFEGLPFSLLEAMDQGLPCVVSDVDGNRDALINEDSGFIYDNLDQLVGYIVLLLENQKERERIGQNAKLRIGSDHDINKSIKLIEDCYSSINN